MRADPPVRRDGRCASCKKQRGRLPGNLVKTSAAVLKAELANDPFCSTTCCRTWHGTALAEGALQAGQRRRYEREGAPA